MKLLINRIKTDKIIKLGTYFSSAIILSHLAYVAFVYSSLPPYLPLFNQMPWGEDRLGIKFEIFLPIIITFAFFSLNLYLSLRIYEKMPLLSRILSITGLLVCILSFIFILRVIRMVI